MVHRRCLRDRFYYSDAHSHTHPHADGYANSHAHADEHADGDVHTHCYTDRHAWPDVRRHDKWRRSILRHCHCYFVSYSLISGYLYDGQQ